MNPDEVGDKYEMIVLTELRKFNPNAIKNGGDRKTMPFKEEYKWYDFEDFGGIEVKGDEIADMSNKYAFDKSTNKEPSGLATTRAYWHILFTLTRYYIIKTDILKWLVEYKGILRYWYPPVGRYLNTMVLHDENFFNVYSGNHMDLYRIPLPAIELFSNDSGKIEDFNLNALL